MMQKSYGLTKNFIVSNILILLSTICYSESMDLNQSYYIYLDKVENNLQSYLETANSEKKYKKLMQSYKTLGRYIQLQKEKKIKKDKTLFIKNKPRETTFYKVNINNSKISNEVNLSNSTLIDTRLGNFINTDRIRNNVQNTNKNFDNSKIEKKKKQEIKNFYINSSVGKNYIGN